MVFGVNQVEVHHPSLLYLYVLPKLDVRNMSDNLESDMANLKKIFVCPECEREFTSKRHLGQHMLLHNPDPL